MEKAKKKPLDLAIETISITMDFFYIMQQLDVVTFNERTSLEAMMVTSKRIKRMNKLRTKRRNKNEQ